MRVALFGNFGTANLGTGQLAHVSYAPARSLQDVMRQLADVDVLVASRFHNVVCALKLGIPTVSLGYADKNALLLGDVGLAAYAGELAESGLPWLCERIEHALAQRETLSRAIRARVKEYERALAAQEEQLARQLPLVAPARAAS